MLAKSLVRGLAAVLTVTSALSAQNLVVNGDFEAPTLMPWIVISGQSNVSVVDKVLVGSGSDHALRFTGPVTMTQSIQIPADDYYQVSFSSRRSHYSEHASLAFGSNTRVWAQLQTGSWCPSGHLVESGSPVWLSAGAYPLWLTVSGATSLHIDDVVLRRVDTPFLFYSDTTHGQANARSFLVMHDRSNNVIVPIMSSHRFATPVTIPTFVGDFWLDPSRGFWFAMPALVSNQNSLQRALQLPLSLPSNIDVGLFLQTIDISGRFVGSRFYVPLRN